LGNREPVTGAPCALDLQRRSCRIGTAEPLDWVRTLTTGRLHTVQTLLFS
jgi:hypothetical protein